jgi:hypothetical protein
VPRSEFDRGVCVRVAVVKVHRVKIEAVEGLHISVDIRYLWIKFSINSRHNSQ